MSGHPAVYLKSRINAVINAENPLTIISVKNVLPERQVQAETVVATIAMLDTLRNLMLPAANLDVAPAITGTQTDVLSARPENTQTPVRRHARIVLQIQFHQPEVGVRSPVLAMPALQKHRTAPARLYHQVVGLDRTIKPLRVTIRQESFFPGVKLTKCVTRGRDGMMIFIVQEIVSVAANIFVLHVVGLVKDTLTPILGQVNHLHVHVDLHLAINVAQASTVRDTYQHAQIVLPTPDKIVRHARQFKDVPATPAIPGRMEEPVHNACPANTRHPKAVYAVTVHRENFRQPLVQRVTPCAQLVRPTRTRSPVVLHVFAMQALRRSPACVQHAMLENLLLVAEQHAQTASQANMRAQDQDNARTAAQASFPRHPPQPQSQHAPTAARESTPFHPVPRPATRARPRRRRRPQAARRSVLVWVPRGTPGRVPVRFRRAMPERTNQP